MTTTITAYILTGLIWNGLWYEGFQTDEMTKSECLELLEKHEDEPLHMAIPLPGGRSVKLGIHNPECGRATELLTMPGDAI